MSVQFPQGEITAAFTFSTNDNLPPANMPENDQGQHEILLYRKMNLSI
jgi:hypothetical protein